jgi:F-box/leucine-rich repeat protein 2/20
MEDLPEPLLADILTRITRASDLNSLSLVSKQLYTFEGEHRDAIYIGCGLNPATEALTSLLSRFSNLSKVEINYSGWTPSHGEQFNEHCLSVLSSQCPLLSDLTLSFCSNIQDASMAYLARCTKLRCLKLISAPAISWCGLSLVAVVCKHLSVLHLVDCIAVSVDGWLAYLGRHGSLEELVVKDCKEISQYDLLKFGPGWQKLQKFEFEINGNYWMPMSLDPSYVPGYPYSYEICCENLKDLRLAHIITEPEIGLRFLLGKCKALETLRLEYVIGLDESEMIALFQRCSNLKSISIWLMPLHCHSVNHGFQFRTPLTNGSLEALALSCPMLEVVELTFTFCDPDWPTEIGFTQKGILTLMQSCPIRSLVLNGASIFYNSGMKGLSSCQFLQTLEIVDCMSLTDAGLDFVIQAPRLSNLTLRKCNNVTDNGIAALACSGKLESLTVIGCRQISQEGVHGAAKSVRYSADTESHDSLKGMKVQCPGD